MVLDQQARQRVEEWRAHPNYGKTCQCGHRTVFHENGTGKCNGVEITVLAKKLADCRFKFCECVVVRL